LKAAAATLYHNPIAYIGADGNVYVTSLDQPLRTGILSSKNARFGNIRWSPDASRFVVAEFTPAQIIDTGGSEITPKLYFVESGKTPVVLSHINIGRPALSAWSLDGSRLAYISGENSNIKVMTSSIAEDDSAEIGTISPCIGEGPYPPPEGYMALDEEGSISALYQPMSIDWTPFGILFAAQCGTPTMSMVSPDGVPLWRWDEIGLWNLPVVSHDGKHALALGRISITDDNYQLYLIDLANGKRTLLDAVKDPFPLGWASDDQTIFYATISGQASVEGDVTRTKVGEKLFYHWPVNGYRATYTISQIAYDGSGKPHQLFQREGYGIGVFSVVPDNSAIIFSFITSSAKRIEAINAGATLAQAQAIPGAQIEVIAVTLNDDVERPRRIAFGGQPAIGNGSFEVGG